MPTYCYLNPKTAEIIDEIHPFGSIPDSIKLKDGTVCKRCLEAEWATQGGLQTETWPIESSAAGINPSQVDEMEAHCKKHGLNTKYNRKNGRAVFRGQEHRKAHCNHFGHIDLDGGYGDPT